MCVVLPVYQQQQKSLFCDSLRGKVCDYACVRLSVKTKHILACKMALLWKQRRRSCAVDAVIIRWFLEVAMLPVLLSSDSTNWILHDANSFFTKMIQMLLSEPASLSKTKIDPECNIVTSNTSSNILLIGGRGGVSLALVFSEQLNEAVNAFHF